ncbi:uncharacterized protein LOC143256915 isoform X3 [Tachypleus tridentatus]|uniref:uncharacterized protein LOC143256915 isoform X3 n=1 Tax=Tachypleus tridentatus TaxID=6853 RepID=UPI003FD0C8EF
MSSSSYPVWEGKVVLTMQKLVIVRCSHDKQWYRARVEGIVDSTRGVCISAYLVDYGYAILVERHWVQYTSETVFDIPFQAVNCFLIGLKPKSMTLLDGITVTHGPSKKWDTAAFEFVQKLVNQSGNMWTEVTYQDEEGNIYGQLFFSIGGETVCLNEELLKQNYAWYSEEEVQKVMSKSKGEAILPKSVSIESSSSTSHLHLLSKANQKNIEKKNYEALKVSERGKLEEEEAGQNSQMSGQFRNEQQLQSYDSVINQNNKPPNYRACVGRGIFRSPPKQVTSLFRVSPDGKKDFSKVMKIKMLHSCQVKGLQI